MLKKSMVIARKEMREAFRSRTIKLNFILPAVLVGLAVPLAFGLFVGELLAEAPGGGLPFPVGPDFFPEITVASQRDYLALIYIFVGVFMLILPLMLPLYISADSFAGEKERKTLQQLLSAPLTDSEILLGKILTSFIPTIITTYLCIVGISIILNLSWWHIYGYFKIIYPNMVALVQLALLYPALAFFAILVMSWVSTKVSRVFEATQTGSVVVFPFLIFIFGAVTGYLPVMNLEFVILVTALFALADFGLFRLSAKRFTREAILSRQ